MSTITMLYIHLSEFRWVYNSLRLNRCSELIFHLKFSLFCLVQIELHLLRLKRHLLLDYIAKHVHKFIVSNLLIHSSRNLLRGAPRPATTTQINLKQLVYRICIVPRQQAYLRRESIPDERTNNGECAPLPS